MASPSDSAPTSTSSSAEAMTDAASPTTTQAAAANAAGTATVHHAQIGDFGVNHSVYRGGMRSGVRSTAQAEQMLHKVPPSHRAGATPSEAIGNTQQYLQGKDASHVISHKNGGSSDPQNLTWEAAAQNRARGSQNMSGADRAKLGVKWHLDNLQGALQAGLRAAPKGAVIGAVTTAPLSLLTNCLRVMRGEISTGEATLETLKDTTIGAGVGGVSAFGITTIATACPPVAVALSAASPLLLTVGAGAMVYEFFKILEDHKEAVRNHYQQLTQSDLDRLAALEAEWQYQHQKNLDYLAESRQINAQINNRPVGTSIQDALDRYLESTEIARSLGAIEPDAMPSFPSSSRASSPSSLPKSENSRFLPAQEQ